MTDTAVSVFHLTFQPAFTSSDALALFCSVIGVISLAKTRRYFSLSLFFINAAVAKEGKETPYEPSLSFSRKAAASRIAIDILDPRQLG